MTGSQVRGLREALRLDPARFAQLIGVHPSTLYRWEAVGDAPVRIEPFQQQILAVAQSQVVVSRAGNERLGAVILEGLLVGGPMRGLFRLLEAAFSECRCKETSADEVSPPVIPMTKYVAWSDMAHGITVVSRETAIATQQHEAARRNQRYADDDDALLAFMASRGAWTCDRADGRMDDEDADETQT